MDDKRKGIYILPNLFTTAALFAGFYAIVQAMKGQFWHAAVAVFIAMIMDGLDGRVARWTHTESDFGAQYDSLSDMVSFGLAPALVVYEWGLSGLGKLGWLAAFVYSAAAALRLARFNIETPSDRRLSFHGLPSPAAAAVVTGLVWVTQSYGPPALWLRVVGLVITVLIGAAMVSNIRYRSFKHIDLKGRVPFIAILAIVLTFVLISLDPARVLFGLFFCYALSGPINSLIRRYRRLLMRHRAEDVVDGPSRPQGRP